MTRAAGRFVAALALLGTAPAPKPTVLVFSYTTGFRHDSIAPGIAAIRSIGARDGFAVVASEDPDVFADTRLARVAAIVLLSATTKPDDPSSEWLIGPRRAALQRFVRRGGGIVGIHAAADSHYGWRWYGALMGARFLRHPPGTPEGEVTLVDRRHPAASNLPSPHRRADEWYVYRDRTAVPRALATFDPHSIGEPGSPYPIAWAHRFEGARVFYTGMGHTAQSFAEPWFLAHLSGGIGWVLGRRVRGDEAPRPR